MFERLRRAVVESFVGAIALGYLFAQGILHFVSIFATPVAGLVTRSVYPEMFTGSAASKGLPLQEALPELIRFILIILVWYVLVRWLYFSPMKKEPSEAAPNPERVE